MKLHHIAIMVFCFVGLLLFQILTVLRINLTFDESIHYRYGEKVLQGVPVRDGFAEASTMPFSAMNVFIPRTVGKLFQRMGLVKDVSAFETVQAGRFVTVFFSFLLALLVMRWAWELYGLNAALAALFFYCFDPNIIAHSQLVMVDLYAALMIVASCYFFWRFRSYGGLQNALISATVLGIAQLAKYTCLVLYPLFFFFIILVDLPKICGYLYKKDFGRVLKESGKFLAYSGLFLLVGLVIVNAGFAFYGTGDSLKKYEFYSDAPMLEKLKSLPPEQIPEPLRKYIPRQDSVFKRLKASLIADMPLPLPTPYLEGLEHISHIQAQGIMVNIYLLGQVRKVADGKGFDGYFFWALLFKTPIALLIMFFWAVVQYVLQWRSKRFLEHESWLLLPVVFFLIYYNYFITMQFGIRSILFVLPLMWIFASQIFSKWESDTLRKRGILVVLLGYFFISILSYWPHYTSYFNEFLPNRKEAYKILADSNVYLGGLEWYTEQYLTQHPETIVSPQKPCSGRLMLNVNELVGIYNPDRYQWLRENFKPVDHVAYAFLIYNISQADLYRVWLKYKGGL